MQSELAYRARDQHSGALPAWFDYRRTHNTYSLAAFLAERLGLDGPSLVVSCACASTAKAFGGEATLKYERVYPATINHAPQYDHALHVAEDLIGRDHFGGETNFESAFRFELMRRQK